MTDYTFASVLVWDSTGGAVKLARRQNIDVLDPNTGLTAAGLKQAGQPVSAVVADDSGRVSFTATVPVVRLVTARGFSQDVPSNDLWSSYVAGGVPFATDGEVSTTKAVRADDTRLSGNVSAALAVGTDLNTITASSTYYVQGTGSFTNRPVADSGILRTYYVSSIVGYQSWESIGGAQATYLRFRGSVGWGAWVRSDVGGAAPIALASPLLTNNTDLDTIAADTSYLVQSSNTHANRPETSSGILRTFYSSSTNILQLWYSMGSSSAVWRRWRGSSSWTAWTRVDAQVALDAAAPLFNRTPRPKLDTWRSARAAAATAPARIVCFGDSRTEGTGTSDVSLRWQTMLQKHLRYQFGVVGGAKFPFIPAYPQTSAPGMPVTRAGTVVQDTTYGLGWRTAQLRDGTSSLTFTFTGTSFKIMHVRASATAVMSIVIDGGAPTVVNTNSTTGGGGSSNAALWSSPALTQGAHTVVITRDASSVAGQYVYVEGLLTFDGDETSGIRVLDAAYHGSSSTFFTSSRNTTAAAAVSAVGSVGLVVIAMGTNDTIGPTAPATYRANLEGLIAALRTSGGFSGSVVLLNLVKPNTITEAVYAPFAEQMAAIARDDAKVEYVDMRREQPDVPNPYTATAGLGLFNDTTHENDYGNAFIAGKLAEILGA